MKTMKKVAVLTMAVLLIGGANAIAQNGRNYSKQGNGYNRSEVCQQIPDLTEDQQTKIKALRVDHMKEMNTLRNQTNELRAKKQTLMSTDNADMKEINSVIDQMTTLQNKRMKTSAKHRQEIRNELNDEQKVYFDSRRMHGNRGGKGMRQGHRSGRGNQGAGYGRGVNANCQYPVNN
ncbi:MAG: Spy/CpxP family protein refolding chaperone [Bacteroidales bacterium]|jgi:Spy/CpxP family protein refolding chaperone|nr:Spy/CpxP family protein refolding chaperone [Bacteroidales bacterium]